MHTDSLAAAIAAVGKYCLKVDEAARWVSKPPEAIRRALKDGTLIAAKIPGDTVIPVPELIRWVTGHPPAEPAPVQDLPQNLASAELDEMLGTRGDARRE